ncbi:hypothetical protein AYI69_g3141 [Smittium culicis]|uniref:Uncharacterized protein n=1 Tax=Smittium culicis TaxID=133412 RepID=A0A1R1YKJ2_9FUNG|nr:hypothetical protein AYI69_g3141 [Smittium culicis]
MQRGAAVYADGCRRLRDRINGIEVSAASHANIYCEDMGGMLTASEKLKYIDFGFFRAQNIWDPTRCYLSSPTKLA